MFSQREIRQTSRDRNAGQASPAAAAIFLDWVQKSELCFVFEASACVRRELGEVKAEEGRWQPGERGKGCGAGNGSRRVGVFNGEWSHLRFLMMIRGGNWLRFTVSLITETEEGENRIKASKLSPA